MLPCSLDYIMKQYKLYCNQGVSNTDSLYSTDFINRSGSFVLVVAPSKAFLPKLGSVLSSSEGVPLN